MSRFYILLCVCFLVAFGQPAEAGKWDQMDVFLQSGVDDAVFPGCVAAVGNKDELLYSNAVGSFTYGLPAPESHGTNPKMTLETLFDMASCTKVLVTTTAIAQFYQRGEVDLDEKVCDERLLGNGFSGQGKDKIALLNLLLHNAGFPPDPRPNYWSPDFGCPETKKEHPLENFSCQDLIYSALLNQTLDNPVGEKFVYSDLSMITMMYVIGKLSRDLHYVSESDLLPGCDQGGPGALECYYEAYVRHFVLEAAHTKSSGFLPPQSVWENCAPAWNDTSYQHQIIQGTVSDGNSYALGGISGHAGLFATVGDVAKITRMWLYAGPGDKLLNDTTVELFTTVYNLTQSSRALGWDTNDYKTNPSMWCGTLSQKSFLHLGYTGTEVCNDPDRQIFTILLTNRVYPVTTNLKIEKFRKEFNTLVQEILDDDIRVDG